MAAFPLGVVLAAIEMRQPALARGVPTAVGVVVLIAGALQFTAWKTHHLACCREAPGRGRPLPPEASAAWRYGLRLGLHCSYPAKKQKAAVTGPEALSVGASLDDFEVWLFVVSTSQLGPVVQQEHDVPVFGTIDPYPARVKDSSSDRQALFGLRQTASSTGCQK